MDSLLDALQEGRLIELPDNTKDHALQFLAHIIEAIPSVRSGTDVSGLVLEREMNSITALGMHFACPHARVPYDDDLICSVGWSPQGIDYDAPDGQLVHIVIMYLVPDNQRNHYLKEISTLAKALMAMKESRVGQLKDLDSTRNFLLDLVTTSQAELGGGTRARMIQLDTRAAVETAEVQTLTNLMVEPLLIVFNGKQGHVVLGQNKMLVEILDKGAGLFEAVSTQGFADVDGWRVVKRSLVEYQEGRAALDCLAVKVNPPAPSAK
ncbi:MAG TPA: PTS sugar transporter subunit IIA [Bacteroidota bacterium]|nr:PTS sugar transporter subunit IIA [Bacteroidota bacterium]